MTFGSPSFGSASPTGPRRNHLGLPSSLVFLFTHATLFSDPGRPSTTSPLRLFCFGFWKADTIAACCFNIHEAVSSFGDCGLPYGLCDSLCTLQPFRSALTAPPHGCNTRYEWLVRPCSTGTFTQLETPSFAWRTGVMFIARLHTPFVLFRIELHAKHFAQFGRACKPRALLVYKHFVPTALFPTDSFSWVAGARAC
jgi:hypothetical protein